MNKIIELKIEVEEEELYIDLFDRKEIDFSELSTLCEQVEGNTDATTQFNYYQSAMSLLELDYVRSIAEDAMSA